MLANKKLKEAILTVESYGHRVIERYVRPDFYHADDLSEKRIATYLDVETTGLDSEKDKIIELALITFEYSKNGKIFRILQEYNQYQDPGIPIPKNITELTGITNEMVRGKNINPELVMQLISDTNLVIAHNAKFDRPFIESFLPSLPKKPWACSMVDIDWSKERIESSKLEYIAYKMGFFFEGHRATNDCLAGIHILASKLPVSKELAFCELLLNARKERFMLWALNAPFEHKDILKSRGYKFNAERKTWVLDIFEDLIVNELAFLFNEVYKTTKRLPIDMLPIQDRFSKEDPMFYDSQVTQHDKRVKKWYSTAMGLTKK